MKHTTNEDSKNYDLFNLREEFLEQLKKELNYLKWKIENEKYKKSDKL